MQTTKVKKANMELSNRLREIQDLGSAASVLYWDQSTYMPTKGAPARGRQLATLQKLTHEKFTDPEIGRLLEQAESEADKLDYDTDDAALLRLTRRSYERATKVPPAFTAEISQHSIESYSVWAEARPENDFAKMQPYLEKTLELSKRYADFFPDKAHPADSMIDSSDYGMSVATIRPVFAALRARTVPLVEAIMQKDEIDNSCCFQHFSEEAQWAFGMGAAKRFGYDLERGRQDKTLHPFMINFSIDDVRITTRFDENRLDDGLFSTLHETGHALYELGVDPALEGLPLADGTSAGVHESQSRLWENIVGRSRGFWHYHYPLLQEQFPQQLGSVDMEEFYRAINKVQPSLIRVDADEITYNLHVIIRFDLELELLEGKLAIADLPEAWHARYESDLGVRAPDDKDGVLQDVHWYAGLIGGAFQGYTLGNIMASQFYTAALAAQPEIPHEIQQGNFDTLHDWLRINIYSHGSKFTTAEILERTTGGGLSLDPYIDYLNAKYGEIYSL